MKLPSLWARVDADIPWQEWWLQIRSQFQCPKNIIAEKWSSQDLLWSRVLDSAHSFTLFKQPKAILIMDADKALRHEKSPQVLLERFERSPHWVIFHSSDEPPKSLKIQVWKAPAKENVSPTDDKASFRWLDTIHSANLSAAVLALDAAIKADQHPLALLQLITRDFRIGRLIHHAHQNRLKESEIASTLRIPNFVIQKWLRRNRLTNQQWAGIFDCLLKADLEMKSSAEGIWVLRKLSFDLIQMTSGNVKIRLSSRLPLTRPSSPNAPLLWTIAPSFG